MGKKNTVNNAVDDLKKLYAMPPYDNAGNLVANDGIFARSINATYSSRVLTMAKSQLGIKT